MEREAYTSRLPLMIPFPVRETWVDPDAPICTLLAVTIPYAKLSVPCCCAYLRRSHKTETKEKRE